MIAPLPIEPEELVIVEVVDGIANTALVHLPAVRSMRGGFRFDAYDFPPVTWPPKCRCVKSGWVYVRDGLLENAAMCPDCETAEEVFVCVVDESAGLAGDTA